MTLNELTDELVRKPLPPTDCRLRPDMRLMEEGNLGQFVVYLGRVIRSPDVIFRITMMMHVYCVNRWRR